ncbi:MAG: hypothetical protein ABJF23_26100 [Bryobacteraceae bacterium]
MAEDTNRLLLVARDPAADLRARINALGELGASKNKALVPYLHDLWNRRRPAEPKAINWDQAAAERDVDLHLILALFQLGDFGLVSQIPALVARSGDVLKGPDSEPYNAAYVLREIHMLSPVAQVVQLSANPNLARNAVRTLQLLNLPSPPTGGPLAAFPQLDEHVTFSISRLAEELKTIAALGKGLIVLSPGVQTVADYDRGEVSRMDTPLSSVITEDLDALGLAYSVTRQGVVICTFVEAGQRWQQQWPELQERLARQRWHR